MRTRNSIRNGTLTEVSTAHTHQLHLQLPERKSAACVHIREPTMEGACRVTSRNPEPSWRRVAVGEVHVQRN